VKIVKIRGMQGDRVILHLGGIALLRAFDASLRDNRTGEPVSRAAMLSPRGLLKLADAIYDAYAPERKRR